MAIRSAVSRHYSEVTRCSDQQFHFDSLQNKWVGNPSLSREVSRYMRSLRKRKAQKGEAAESVRALKPEDMKELYNYCKNNGAIGARQHVCLSTWWLTCAACTTRAHLLCPVCVSCVSCLHGLRCLHACMPVQLALAQTVFLFILFWLIIPLIKTVCIFVCLSVSSSWRRSIKDRPNKRWISKKIDYFNIEF